VDRLRGLLAHGGIAVLAVIFALAFATFNLAAALAYEVVAVIDQHASGDEGGGLKFTLLHTTIYYQQVLLYAITVVLVAAALLGTWLLARRATRVCPECRSQVPHEARICRFCTSELEPELIDA
jgi:hypothetical protein